MVQVCFACMHVCAHVSLVPQSQERVLDPLQLEFQIMVSYHVCAKNQTWVLWQSSKWLPEWALSLHSPHTTSLLTCCLGRKKKRWKFIFFQVTLLQSTLDVVMIGDLQMALRSSVCVLAGFQDVSPSQRVHSEKCGTSKHTHTPSQQKGCLHEGRQAWYLHMYVYPCINTHVCLTSLFWNFDYYCGWMDVVGHYEPVEVWGQLCVAFHSYTGARNWTQVIKLVSEAIFWVPSFNLFKEVTKSESPSATKLCFHPFLPPCLPHSSQNRVSLIALAVLELPL